MTLPEACEQIRFLIMKVVDNEASHEEEEKVKNHISQCSECRDEYHKMLKIKGATGEMKKQLLPEMAWDEYWRHLYNRLERGIAWIFISIGAIILLGYAVVDFVNSVLVHSQLTPLQKGGILIISLGAVILFISVLREKLMVRRYDKYREVKR